MIIKPIIKVRNNAKYKLFKNENEKLEFIKLCENALEKSRKSRSSSEPVFIPMGFVFSLTLSEDRQVVGKRVTIKKIYSNVKYMPYGYMVMKTYSVVNIFNEDDTIDEHCKYSITRIQ